MANLVDTIVKEGTVPVNLSVEFDNASVIKIGAVVLVAITLALLINHSIANYENDF